MTNNTNPAESPLVNCFLLNGKVHSVQIKSGHNKNNREWYLVEINLEDIPQAGRFPQESGRGKVKWWCHDAQQYEQVAVQLGYGAQVQLTCRLEMRIREWNGKTYQDNDVIVTELSVPEPVEWDHKSLRHDAGKTAEATSTAVDNPQAETDDSW